MNNTSEIETKPQTDSEAIGNNSVLSIEQQIAIVGAALSDLKYESENNANFRFMDLEDLKLAESLMNSLEALKIKIDCNYDYHVVIIPTHRMKHFITYLENIEKEERKEQNNG